VSATPDPSSLNGEEQYLPRHMDDWHWIPLQSLGKQEMRDAIARALAFLPVKQRQVLVLSDVQKLSTDDTAKILGIGEEDVKKRLQSARLQMRDALAAGVYPEWVRAASGKVG
jgi:RNA polymerase sigma factor (sigma-70 family)